ncbi:hypothetical protein CCACVL1_09448 [Corchorus capsularis]|uniref:Uncharacterized protein n=1 Tax=Corchorus capsularis TaxID=210143 RepID=A0A1R3IW39_COCAP|nr:hypothetical protein CCACVL1_09448 [Corchorus capsularis]
MDFERSFSSNDATSVIVICYHQQWDECDKEHH